MTFYKRTISIRKTVHFADGLVSPKTNGALVMPMQARNISCTITVDVPVLQSLPNANDTSYAGACEWDEIADYLHEHDFAPDDEIGIEVQALPERCPFRKRTGAVVYRRVQQRLFDELNLPANHALVGKLTTHVLAVDEDGGYTFVENGTPVVVRVRDIFPDYAPTEDK